MYRSSLAIVAASLLASAAPCAAASSPAPAPSSSAKAVPRGGGFSSAVHKPSGSSHVSSAACNRRNVGTTSPTQRTMGPNGASQSNTLIAVPIGGGSASSATEQHQISEACGRSH